MTWVDINNGETGLSVRSKLNELGNQVQTNTTDVVTLTSDTSAIDDRVITIEDKVMKIGFVDYNDLATATTPIVVPSTLSFVDLINDTLGEYTIRDYLPLDTSDIWDKTTNRFDFSQLSLGTMLDIRVDIDVTTTSANQYVELVLELGTDIYPYEVSFYSGTYKTAGIYKISRYNGVYIGNITTSNGAGRFRIKSDGDATVKVNGWYVKITTK